MRTATTTFLLLFILIIVFTSCEKEVNYATGNGPDNTGGTGNTNNIEGDYDFVGLVAHTESTVTVSQAGQELKAITVSDYSTQSNVGTVTIATNQFISTGLGYSIDTTMNAKTYDNNVLVDDSNFPFVMSVPPASS